MESMKFCPLKNGVGNNTANRFEVYYNYHGQSEVDTIRIG